MNYQERQEARKQRMLELARKARVESEGRWIAAKTMNDAIPFGQPVMPDHSFYRRDLAFRARMTTNYRKSFELTEKAKYYEEKASTIGTGGISSDDPAALEKLKTKVANLEASHAKMVAFNKAMRANDMPAMLALGFSAETVQSLLEPDFCGRTGFPDFSLTNSSANIRRLKLRIEQLEKRQGRQAAEIKTASYTLREDPQENRVMFIFEGKPNESTRAILKQHAFKWSPSRGAWVRYLNNAGIWAAKSVHKMLNQQEGS